MKRCTALLILFVTASCAQSVAAPLSIEILPAAYLVDGKQVDTALELDTVVARTKATEARVVAYPQSSYEQVAAALHVLQQRNISLGLVGNVQEK
ncbi:MULTISPECIES: hypothetical protein [Hydrocarboniphaga]|uniref:hypothetical protein n=1 Tax=Hydrocarboniphaga TaxID=243627 RepID=UPI0012F8AAFE|nr:MULTISPECIES: hypothetical protein [Hydrocarboniphaga]MDZ4077871.1 hypothetical protein [Hydrocarboniphaga sp.]